MTWRAQLSLRHLRAVFDRHADRHMQVAVPAPPGVLAWWRAGQIEVRIDQADGPATLECGGIRHVVRPDLAGCVQIAVRPAEGATCHLSFGQPVRGPFALVPPDRAALARARMAHCAGFVLALGRALPHLLRWVRASRNPAHVAALRDALGLAHVTAPSDIDGERLVPLSMTHTPGLDRPVVLVLAVYNAFDLLPEMLDRLERHTDIPFELVVIEDCSTDPQVRPWLNARLGAFAAGPVHLIENERNLGFVASANLGLAHAARRGAHAILINSDVFVPPGWAGRLIRPLIDHPETIASVTPMSGASGLTTVPAIGPGGALPPGGADRVDRAAQAIAGGEVVDLPTGMGFCMAMSAPFLARVPQFDMAFGAGYGEETDWCCRTGLMGGRHVALPGLFVDHRGNASFGREERDRRALEAAGLIRARYRQYETQVARFVETDPLLTERLALAVVLAAQCAEEGRLPLFIAHSLGGGAEADLASRIAALRARGAACAVLRLGGVRRWTVEVHGPGDGMVTGRTDDFAVVRRLLDQVTSLHLVYSCAVGDRDAANLPGLLLSLLSRGGDRLDVLVHDYLPLGPSYTLLGSDGWFHGIPAEDDPDPAHSGTGPDGAPVLLRDWRRNWGELMQRANRIEVFSASSHAILRQVWPELAPSLALCPHPVSPLPGRRPDAGGRALGVLGNIRLHKGARVLVALAEANPELRIVLVGSLDPAVICPPNIKVLGRYRREDIQQIARENGVGAWLVPSIWPETFCFALHEALATGLPTIGFDLGAQADALHAARAGGKPAYVLSRGRGPQEAAAAVAGLLRELRA